MNMKKTFAGAMAGALAVSAMATSASAAVPGPGEYVIDLTKEGDAYATVQFTFDADYMLTRNDFVTLTVADSKNILARDTNASGTPIVAKEIKAEFIGSAGTTKQTVTYNDTWDNVNYYGGSLTVSGNGFKIPLNTMVDPDGWGKDVAKQGLYTDKYTSVKEALAIKKSDGKNVYPLLKAADGAFYKDDNNVLAGVYFDKIVVTAKFPITQVKNLSELNANWGYKGAVTATLTGITDIVITNNDADTTNADAAVTAAEAKVTQAKADLKTAQDALDELNAAKVAAASYDAAVAGKAALAAPAAPATTVDIGKAGAPNSVTVDGKTKITEVVSNVDGKTYWMNGKTSLGEKKADEGVGIEAYNESVKEYAAYEAKVAAFDKIIDAYTGKTAAEIEAEIVVAEANVTKADKALAEAKEELNTAKADASAAATTFVGVDVLNNTAAATIGAETLFTSAEKSVVGPKSGIWVKDAKFNANNNNKMDPLSGTVHTVTADIGAYKPDALRQIRDAIGTNTGVTLTFEAKNDFDDAAYKSWLSTVTGNTNPWSSVYGTTVSGNLAPWGTDNTKDSYDVWGESMFTGAIVLNRDFSKQFSQSGLVDWGTKTITFDWDELTEGRFYDAAVVLHSLEIMSTQNVEWVSCTVTVPEQEASSDNADSSQGKTEEPSEIETTPVQTEVITEAPVETTAPVTEAPAETTAVAPVQNIPTGNAPVALAVIPVALAAAAVIAKKRG